MHRLITLLILVTLPAVAQQSCDLCSRPSTQVSTKQLRYTENRNVSLNVCELCVAKYPKCAICRQPAKAEPHQDGRIICPECKKVGIFTQQQAETLYKEVRTFVDTLLGGQMDRVPEVRVVDKDEIQTRKGGRAVQVTGFYRAYNPEMVYVLSGHTAKELGPTIAHEYTHAWQSRNCPSQDRTLKEGFAVWVEYQYLLAKGERNEASSLLDTGRPDYDEGLQKCLEVEKKQGRKGLLKFVTTQGNF